jgi:hypothetical protein
MLLVQQTECYNTPVLPSSAAHHLSWAVADDTGLPCDKATVLIGTIQIRPVLKYAKKILRT